MLLPLRPPSLLASGMRASGVRAKGALRFTRQQPNQIHQHVEVIRAWFVSCVDYPTYCHSSG